MPFAAASGLEFFGTSIFSPAEPMGGHVVAVRSAAAWNGFAGAGAGGGGTWPHAGPSSRCDCVCVCFHAFCQREKEERLEARSGVQRDGCGPGRNVGSRALLGSRQAQAGA